MRNLKYGTADPYVNYAASKAANWFLAYQLAKRVHREGIVSVTQNPGNLKTGSWRNVPRALTVVLEKITLYDAQYGAYTELWAGISEEVGEVVGDVGATGRNGGYIFHGENGRRTRGRIWWSS